MQRLFVPKMQKTFSGIFLADKIKGAGQGLIELNSIPSQHYGTIYNSLLNDYKVPEAQIRKVNNSVIHVFGLATDTQAKWVPNMQQKYSVYYLDNDINGNAHQTVELNNIPGDKVEVIKKAIEKDFKVPDFQIK